MSTDSPVRPVRRVAARRKVIDDDDSDEDEVTSRTEVNDDAGEFTPAATRSRRSIAPRKPRDSTATPRRTGRRTTASTVNDDDTQNLSPPESTTDNASPTRGQSRVQPAKRRSTKTSMAARRTRSSIAPTIVEDETTAESTIPALPTPDPSVSSPSQTTPRKSDDTQMSDVTPRQVQHPAPLADITTQVLNEQPASQEPAHVHIKQEINKVDAKFTVMQKPMDIVVRTRQAALPVAEPTGPTKRTVITNLILCNFKSYAGRQEVGPFHVSFSSVVGPNGSGKSNVIDSLLFVFGFRASKMRQGKLSALIHNSAQFPDLDHCEVEVHFQEIMDMPDGGHEVLPDSQLIISRRAFKNNSSNYYINQKTSSFTAVTTLLKDRGVDLDHKRFLILQGEVESIAQMKPKAATEHDDGLLEYLEDIIGTSKYKTPIEEAEAETDQLNSVCAEKMDRVKHVEKEKDALEDKKNTALAFIRNENELTTKRSALYQIYHAECKDNIGATEEILTTAKAEYEEEMQKYKGNEHIIKQMQAEHKRGLKQYEVLETEAQSILKEAAKAEKDTVKYEEKKKFFANKIKKLEKTVESSNFGVAESNTAASRAADDIERNQNQLAQFQEDLQNEEHILADVRNKLKGKTQGLSDQIAAKQAKLEPWTQKINDEKSNIAVAQSELDIMREREQAGVSAMSDAHAKVTSLQETQAQRSEEFKELATQQKVAKQNIVQTSSQLEKLVAQEPAMRATLSSARQKADEARSSLSATKAQGDCLAGLMRLRDTGRISGLHGRLGTLGAIDAKYDVAISTACPSLDNIVVDSVEVGQQCIEYLRSNNLGRANFILLDRLAQRNLEPIETPEKVPRLFDLVKSRDKQFMSAFYSVMGDTLVAKDLVQANRIAYGAKRWRVVTLDGQLIDKSGTMSGGGTRVSKGAMSSKIVADTSKEQVSALEVDRDALEKSFAELQAKQQELKSQLDELQRSLPKLETAKQKLELAINSLQGNISDAVARVAELKKEHRGSSTDENHTRDLEKQIHKSETNIGKLQEQTAGLEEEIKALQDKIMEIGGVQLRTQKAKVDGLKEQIEHRGEELSSAEVAQAKAEKQRAKHEKSRDQASAELSDVTQDAEASAAEMKQHANSTAEIRRQAEEAQEALESKKEELTAMKSKLDEETLALNGGREREIELRNRMNDNEKVLKENQHKLRHWLDKLSKLVLQNIRFVTRQTHRSMIC